MHRRNLGYGPAGWFTRASRKRLLRLLMKGVYSWTVRIVLGLAGRDLRVVVVEEVLVRLGDRGLVCQHLRHRATQHARQEVTVR